MSSRVITRELWEAILAAFRSNPGQFSYVQERTGVGRRLAKRAWDEGWLPRIPYARPIRIVLEEEKFKARAEQRRQEELARHGQTAEQKAAAEDARKATAQEGQMISAGRATVLGLTFTVNQLIPTLKQMGVDIAADVAAGKLKGNPEKAMRALREVASSLRMLTESGMKLLEAERLVKGEPTSIIGVQGGVDDMSLEEAERTVIRATNLFALARRRGHITPSEDPGVPH